MILTNKAKYRAAWYTTVLKTVMPVLKNTFKPTPVKFPFKYFIITVLSTIIIWTLFASALIYRNAYKPEISKLADILHFSGRREKHRTKKAITSFLTAPFNWVAANLNSEEIPHLYLDIKFKHYQKLIKKREEALTRGFRVTTPDSYIPATMWHKNDSYKVKLRLKGDQVDHFTGDKWSFRIHMKGKDHLFGTRRFSLQDPKTREFEGEIIFFEALRREGILTPRYFFIDLTINGKYAGVMAFEEHFSKELLESQRRKESVILKFDESHFFYNSAGPFDNFKNNLIKPFRFNKIKKSKKLFKDLKTATGLLRGFSDGTLSSSQVFDVQLMGRYLAVSSVWGAWHPIRWRNIRFYYNPITSRLEPIGYDAHLPYFKRQSVEPSHKPFGEALLKSDLAIRPFYEQTLEKLKNEAEKGITEEWVKPIQKKNLRILHKEYPLLGGINLFGMAESAFQSLQRSKSTLDRYRKILTVHLIDNDPKYLELVNHLPEKIIITQMKWVDMETGESGALDVSTLLKYPFSLPRTPARTAPITKNIFLKNFIDKSNIKIVVTSHIEGNEKLWTTDASNYFPKTARNPVPYASLAQTLNEHPFLSYSSELNSLKIAKGEWIVNSSIVVPTGVTLIIEKKTTLKFNPESSIIARGPILIEGTEKFPVILKGLDDLGEKSTWQGISVLDSQKPSNWSHLKIFNTSGVRNDGWALSGGVNFYESDIEMDHVVFSGNQSEDSLNIVRSKFDLKNMTIKNTISDAFDSDFSKGLVENGMFENIGSLGGGDGIDASGSEIVVTRSNFNNISDKALSVGEESQMKITDVNIKNVSIGVASKDGSKVTISGAIFLGIKKAGLMAYIKKSEYGPAEIVAKSLAFNSTGTKFIIQKGNTIVVDGVEVPPSDLDVEDLYSSEVKP
jgi:hypothetical protein